MRLLLDTHAWLWLIAGDSRMPTRVRAELEASQHTSVISIASCWEVSIKVGLGKLALPAPLATLLSDVSRAFEILPVRMDHVERLPSLPRHHGDPFDRMLVAQALVEGLTIVTADGALSRYPAPIFWGE